MGNTLGTNITLTLFGESHGEAIGVVVDGLSSGIFVDHSFIQECLSKRRPSTIYETKRIEKDSYKIISGVFNSYTTGAPLCILIENTAMHSNDYEINRFIPRPSHADFVSYEKYHGFEDYRGGGHFSGRLTAPIVASGAIILKALEKLNIKIGCHIKQCGTIRDQDFSITANEIDDLNKKNFPVIGDVEEKMQKELEMAAKENDSIGGIIQSAITGLPQGIGEPWFDSLESRLSEAIFAIGGVKGIEFGSGFEFANLRGSIANDAFYMDGSTIKTKTNHNGGINGGISNGMPILFNVAIKPTPSIYKTQDSVNMKEYINTTLTLSGRHDPAIIRRINIVIRCISAFVIADMLTIRFGNDVLKNGFTK